ncbi:transcriptional regulator, TrmB family [Actinobacteria bacterium OK074]|nr:transcriptional regulator, TrmB family [Actinobacteria bacterium OK074]
MLGAIGLDETHEAAYRALVAAGATDVPALARRLILGESVTERALHRLEQHGLAARSQGRPEHWVAAPPGAALGALLTRRRDELAEAERAAARLAEEYRTRAAGPAGRDPVEVVTGAAAVARRLHQLTLGAGGEVCALVTADTGTPPSPADPRPYAFARERTVGRGVRHRVVAERALLDAPAGTAALTAALARDERVRVAPRVPTPLVIADRTVAMVPLGPAEPAALVVHAGGLVELLAELFESVWREALPLRLTAAGTVEEAAPDGPDDTDLRILSLLLAGLTDASVAKQLDLGLRTVQRRVKHLMELAGVTTRLQLGWHAYDKGWATRD